MNASHRTGIPTILVVENDFAVVVTIQQILATANYRVVAAHSRDHALRLAHQKHLHIDLALLDVRMPGMPATALADELAFIRPNVRVLFISGFVDEEIIRIKVVDQRAGFIAEPVRSDGLLSTVREALEVTAAGHAVRAAAAATACFYAASSACGIGIF